MSTTTIRLPDELKTRVAQVAASASTSAHNFILQAIAEKTEQAEQQAALEHLAQQRDDKLTADGHTIAWSDMRQYLRDRASAQPAKRPKPRRVSLHITQAPRV
jgi:predicted transcriptional regulator